jgi:hypothetical protein
MRAREFTEEETGPAPVKALGQAIGGLIDRGNQALYWPLNRAVDSVSQKDIARMQPQCAKILAQIKAEVRKQIAQQVQDKKTHPTWLELLDRILAAINIRVASNIEIGTHVRGYDILVDSSRDYVLDDAGLTWSIAHEVGHILQLSFYKTHKPGDPQSNEKFADYVATGICRQLGYSRAEVFNKTNSALIYWLKNRPTSGSPSDSHPSVYQRRQAARDQGFDLSKGPEIPTSPAQA